ncbi:MAG: BON domain-containing protein [Rhodothermaceae bacterium]|nr:BON domain-containing protein [Rhodothermaceae bacterium]
MMKCSPARPLAFLLLVLLFLPASAQAQRSLAEKIEDLRHSAAVRTVLLEDAQTGPYNLRVRTEDGVVILSGTVPTLGIRNHAATLAEAVPGVQIVRNEINLDGQADVPVTVTQPVAAPEPAEDEERASEAVEALPNPIPAQSAPVDDSEEPVYHRVERGETLFSLARRYETTVGEIQRLNRLGSSTTIEIGQRLRVK